MKQPRKIDTGIWYRGRAMLNEFGEWTFEPEQTGAREGVIKELKRGDGWKCKYSKQHVFISIKIKRDNQKSYLIKEFLSKTTSIINVLSYYEI